jgi:uncharacterized protein YidB (DUF937 family)
MSRSTPSLLALLGLVAVAGYQNRGKISDMLDSARRASARQEPGADAPSGGLLAQIGQFFDSGPGGLGTTVSDGLQDLLARFRTAGQGLKAESWVASGANLPLHDTDLEAALGDETLAEIGRKTGLSRAELLRRLSTALPDVVNRLTPEGRLPTAAEAQAQA